MLQENFEENIGLLIHDVARLLRVLYDRQMASIGLTRSQWWLLTYLRFRDGINQSELGVLMDIEKAPLIRQRNWQSLSVMKPGIFILILISQIMTNLTS